MQRLEVSVVVRPIYGSVRPIYGSLGVKRLTTTTHPPNVNFPSSRQQVTARLFARKVSVAWGNRAQDPLVRDTTL